MRKMVCFVQESQHQPAQGEDWEEVRYLIHLTAVVANCFTRLNCEADSTDFTVFSSLTICHIVTSLTSQNW